MDLSLELTIMCRIYEDWSKEQQNLFWKTLKQRKKERRKLARNLAREEISKRASGWTKIGEDWVIYQDWEYELYCNVNHKSIEIVLMENDSRDCFYQTIGKEFAFSEWHEAIKYGEKLLSDLKTKLKDK